MIASVDLDASSRRLREALDLGEPFHDPAVGVFGLANSVFALGDCFLEVVSPIAPETAAGRQIARHGGDCGYMAIFDLEDLDAARARARDAGVRVAWEVDLPDISTTHLHPADMRGAIVSLDRSRPYGTWRWGGPEWTGARGTGAAARLLGVTVAVSEPEATATRWSQIIGAPLRQAAGGPALEAEEASVRFVARQDGGAEGIVAIAVALAPAPATDAREGVADAAREPLALRFGDVAVRVERAA